MNIGIVCYPTYGGSGVVATELGKGLALKGHSVHFITYKQPFRLDSFHPNISYHEVSFENYALFQYPPYETALASRMVDVVQFEKLDILHVHYAIPHASAAYLAQQILKEKGISIPFITTLHGTDITLVGKDKSFLPVVEFSINKSSGVTTVSHSLKKDTLDSFQINNEIEVIHNFINLNRFSKIEKPHFRKLVAQDDERILIHISNFRKVKRTEDVIKMFDLLVKQLPSKLLMVGDGPERQKCEELCRELKICDSVKFLGKQEAVEELFAISDLMVLPSESESFGLAALEAMACHVPVLSSNAGGLPELIVNGENGFMCEVGDIESMAESAKKVLQSEAILKEFKAKAYKTAQKFDIEIILPQYESYYKKILAK
ncbi:MAG: N-acetyl-alpha-D-glucosaminyl L-malate synthase BshA [Chitinophagales bacterium]|jgi:N-acetyl-alpha-D-glucosaminyl L-malate synthase BshA|nr:N-acetyl-alpha-D-glucosaminyl L-malate synthase BshA [Sphingobacteriales bacterium]